MVLVMLMVVTFLLIICSLGTVEGEVGLCSGEQMKSIMGAGEGKEVCMPRPTVVELPSLSPDYELVAPTHVSVARCGGSCPHSYFSCVPAETTYKDIPVMITEHSITPGVVTSLCTTLSMEEHMSCQCGCQATPSDCTTMQTFVPYECSCACMDKGARAACVAAGWHWDSPTCQCMCPDRPYPACPSSYVYDYIDRCACVPMQYYAFTDTEIVFVILLLGSMGALVSLAQCYRRKVGLFKHLRATPRSVEVRQVLETMNCSLEQSLGKRRNNVETIPEEEAVELISVHKRNSL
jgi:hypothetical protein